MPDDSTPIARSKIVALVVALGAVGGFLNALSSAFAGQPAHIERLVDALICAALGAGAGFAFVFVIANTDRSDLIRLGALALLAGFSPIPVLEAGNALIRKQSDDKKVAEAKAAVRQASQIAQQLQRAPSDARAVLESDLVRHLQEATSLAGTVDSTESRAAIASALAAHKATALASTSDPAVASSVREAFERAVPPRSTIGPRDFVAGSEADLASMRAAEAAEASAEAAADAAEEAKAATERAAP